MRKHASIGFIAACLIGCGTVAEKEERTSTSRGAAGSELKWYYTCGDPVCYANAGSSENKGVRSCVDEQAGNPCSPQDDVCDPGVGCGVLLLCTDHDPRGGPGGCPISREKYKQDIHYLASEDLEQYHQELLSLPLATYRYRNGGPSDKRHLGFMIDGHESMICVQAEHDMVDIYGYTSMAVAALKVQARQIEDLRQEVKALQRKLNTRPRLSRTP